MALPLPTKAVLKFFFKDGITPALFYWLNFRLFVAKNKLKLPPIDKPVSSTRSANGYLTQWQKQQQVIMPKPWVFGLLSLIAAIAGFVTMAGVLNYNHNQPINLWLPIALFAFIPLLLTLSSLYFSVFSPTKQLVDGHLLISTLVDKLTLTPFLPYKNLLLPWLFWQSQTLALLFSVSALLGFFVLATFQDYSFAWSSTLITNNETMIQLMAALSWPWHWIVASPSAELVSQSRIMLENATSHGISGEGWWPTLVMAMIVYGILPRLLLALFLRQNFVKQLRLSIVHSSDVEQFLVAQSHQASHNPILSEKDYAAPDTVDIHQANVDLITWQQPGSDLATVKNLGNADWLEDEQWLNSPASIRVKPVLIIVDPMQTPTGELADCIDLLQQNNVVDLVLLSREGDGDRYASQLKSWQFFAKHHNITLKKGF
jgi:hypothetical protein